MAAPKAAETAEISELKHQVAELTDLKQELYAGKFFARARLCDAQLRLYEANSQQRRGLPRQQVF